MASKLAESEPLLVCFYTVKGVDSRMDSCTSNTPTKFDSQAA